MKKLSSLFVISTLSLSFSAQAAPAPSPAMGKGLYEQQGSNSCLYCHGIEGQGGKVKDAANLTQPKTWKSYKALGGDAAFAKNKEEFRKKLNESVANLIEKGAIAHNMGYKGAGYDWSKIQKFNSQMLGLSGAPSSAWLTKYKDKGVTKEIAAQAAMLHLANLDKQGVLK